ncbi:CARDB domain-containing protein [Sorangium sp. So ce1335]|uniref:CARDB domain-containing protein n=1 Tax=Sorangium sp. So ce1335 TaxID=3133335 RepID=UPI003F5F2F3B
MRARRSVAWSLIGGLLAAGCGGDEPEELRAARLAVVGSADLAVHAPEALGAQRDAAIAATADASILVAVYTDPRGALASPISLSGIARSADGGRTFAEVLGPNGEPTLPSASGAEVLGEPRVAHDPRRDVFVVSSTFVRSSDGVQGICVHGSGSGSAAGTSWSAPAEVTPSFVAGESAEQASLDVNAATGRLSVTWVQRGGASPRILYSHSDDLGQTWSAAAVLAQAPAGGDLDGPSARVLPGTTDGDSIVYAVWRSIEPGASLRNIGCRRSTDGGATWEPPVLLDDAGYPPEDQVPGVDHARSSPSIDVDLATGQVYVVYQRSGDGGTGDIALRAFTGPCATGAAVLLNSDPGHDRAQFFPFVAVDRSTGTAHVVYYDQGVARSGDLTEVVHTASIDRGATWSPPAPITDRPFHAGHGNDASRLNLGERIGGVALAGELYSVFSMAGAGAGAPRFDEGQPASAHMIAPNVHLDVLDEFARVPPLRAAGTRVADPACGALANERVDPGELVEVGVYLENHLLNPVSGRTTVSGITATLATETPSVTVARPSATYPDIEPLRTVASDAPFLLRTDRAFTPGAPIDLTLTVSSDQGTIELPIRLETGGPGTPDVLLREDFDAAGAPALPSDWRSERAGGPASTSTWVVSQTLTPGNNAAFHDEDPTAAHVSLVSPAVTIPEGTENSLVMLDFDLTYELEDDPQKLVQAFDGLTLRIEDLTAGATPRAVLAEAFAEQIVTGAVHHFPKHLPARDDPDYLSDQSVWSGSSGGTKRVSIRFPGEGMRGRTVQLRFDYTQDDSQICTDIGRSGPCGVAIDNVVLAAVPVAPGACGADLAVTLTDAPDPVAPGAQLTTTITVANEGPGDATDVEVTSVLPVGATFVGATGVDWTCNLGEEEGLVCRRASLASGASASIAVTVVAPALAPTVVAAEIETAAKVTAREHDSDPADNEAKEETAVSIPVRLIGYMTVLTDREARDNAIYSVLIHNTGGRAQPDNAGFEFIDVLPPELSLNGAFAEKGAVSADPFANTVGWSGTVEPGEWVVLTIDTRIRPLTEGLVVRNQGTIFFDADSDGVNESSASTDDALFAGAADPTVFTVLPAICGDGVLGRGEACDDGNVLNGDCCSALCAIEPPTVLCRPSGSLCDPGEYCDGAGRCPDDVRLPDGARCDDSDLCNGIELCFEGNCISGIPLDCDDRDPTTADACHPLFGCHSTPALPVEGAGGSAGTGLGGGPNGDGGGVGGGRDMGDGGAGGDGAGGDAGGGRDTGGGGAGGSPSGTGGAPSGAGGSPSGSGGTPSGAGGTPSGAGGTPSGAGGTPSGAGGTPSGAGGTPSGAGGSPQGAGGAGGAAASGSGGGDTGGGRDAAGGGGEGGHAAGGAPPEPCCCFCVGCTYAAIGDQTAPASGTPRALALMGLLLALGRARRRRRRR